ncbi:hypothetical protein HOT57_gp56 [Pseudomonas phage phCDa]|uniref:Uncharacterized protein n=1 Tax=Pseudomonas phage phCDa TaxID=2268587 RepID=A0A2Z5H8T5_9CAUD|nr:hypothetical protein HOT57_gp56 [Pseudomonas phage phCDa]AXC36500.1 hypothetical protein phCDa_56 [Pseudomonas phage phCDa]
MALQDSQTLDETQTNKVTTWACTTPSFTLDSLSGQIHRLRDFIGDAHSEARDLIHQWKRQGKIKFVRGYWKWQF